MKPQKVVLFWFFTIVLLPLAEIVSAAESRLIPELQALADGSAAGLQVRVTLDSGETATILLDTGYETALKQTAGQISGSYRSEITSEHDSIFNGEAAQYNDIQLNLKTQGNTLTGDSPDTRIELQGEVTDALVKFVFWAPAIDSYEIKGEWRFSDKGATGEWVSHYKGTSGQWNLVRQDNSELPTSTASGNLVGRQAHNNELVRIPIDTIVGIHVIADPVVATAECQITAEAQNSLKQMVSAWQASGLVDGVEPLIREAELKAAPPLCDSAAVVALSAKAEALIEASEPEQLPDESASISQAPVNNPASGRRVRVVLHSGEINTIILDHDFEPEEARNEDLISGRYTSDIISNDIWLFKSASSKYRNIQLHLTVEGSKFSGTSPDTRVELTGEVWGNVVKFIFWAPEISSTELKGEWRFNASGAFGEWYPRNNSDGGTWNLTRQPGSESVSAGLNRDLVGRQASDNKPIRIAAESIARAYAVPDPVPTADKSKLSVEAMPDESDFESESDATGSAAEIPVPAVIPKQPECKVSDEARLAIADARQAWRDSSYSYSAVYNLITQAETLAAAPSCDSERALALANEARRRSETGQTGKQSLVSSVFVDDTGCEVGNEAQSAINKAMMAWRRARYVAEASRMIADAWQQVSSPQCNDEKAVKLAYQARAILERPENRFQAKPEFGTRKKVDNTAKNCGDFLGEGARGGGGDGAWVILLTSTTTTTGCIVTSSSLAISGSLESLPDVPDDKLYQIQFASINHDRLATDLSRGGGEYLTILGTMHDCEAGLLDRYDEVMQSGFARIFPQAMMAPEMLLIQIEAQIDRDEILRSECSPVYF